MKPSGSWRKERESLSPYSAEEKRSFSTHITVDGAILREPLGVLLLLFFSSRFFKGISTFEKQEERYKKDSLSMESA